MLIHEINSIQWKEQYNNWNDVACFPDNDLQLLYVKIIELLPIPQSEQISQAMCSDLQTLLFKDIIHWIILATDR